jgi:hypothetical protein
MRKTKKNRKRSTLAKIRSKLYSKRKGRGIGASKISARRTQVSARAVSVETALAEAKRAIAKAEVAAKAEERAEEMAWAATGRETATRVAVMEARVERAEARAAIARETAEKAVAEWKNAVARETTDKAPVVDLVGAKDAAAMALAVAEKAIAEAEIARLFDGAALPHEVLPAERWHPGTEARIPRKEAWEARETAEKAVAEWKNLSRTFPR